MSDALISCLPIELRATAVLKPIAAGLSGAGVYRVDANGAAYVLKIATAEPLSRWQQTCAAQLAAGRAGIAPAVIHVDEERRAVVSEFVVDRSFPARFGDPATRELAMAELADTLRRLHALPIPPGSEPRDAQAICARIWPTLATFPLPAFARAAIERALAEEPPPLCRALALCHNDVNPGNLVWDGARVLLLDWDSSAPNDPLFDLASIAVFLRLDDDTSARLIALHDAAPVAPLPARFVYNRRFMSAFIGMVFLHLAHVGGHPGDAHAEPISLLEIYEAMRIGTLNPGSPQGQWSLAMAMLTTSAGS
jgi:aminoglycoside phosphotransferase (APT) family kinase protein